MLFNAPGAATMANGVLELHDVRGEAGTTARLLVRLPTGSSVVRARVNGRDVPVATRRADRIELDRRFDGVEVHRLQPVIVADSMFAGGHITGTFSIPKRVFEQLATRRRAWPIPWTAEDYQTTWLVPERLLLYAPLVGSDDRVQASLVVDGQPVGLRKAYSAVRAVPSTFVGLYADLSSLEPDRTYRFELEVPELKPGAFRGLFFENVEPEYTTALVPLPEREEERGKGKGERGERRGDHASALTARRRR